MQADDRAPRGRLVPAKPADADPARYRLDEGTLRLLELVDGERDVIAIAEAIGADPAAVSARLEMLSRAGLVTIAELAPAAEPAVASEPVPEVAELEISESGTLAERPAPALLAEVSSSGLNGAIRFERGGDRVAFYFAAGQPIGVRSECPRHELGEMLYAAGKIDQAVQALYRAAMERGTEHPVSALRQAGISDKATLAALLAWHGGAILKEVMAWPDGTYGIAPGAPVPPRVAKVRIGIGAEAVAVKAGWREGQVTAAEQAFLESNAARYLVVDPSAGGRLAALGLGEKEARFVRNLIVKPLQIREALSISTLYRSPTRKLIVGLVESGAFSLHDTNPFGVSAIPIEELIPYAERLERDNDFDVLAAHPSSTAQEIAARYKTRRAEFDDERFPGAAAQHLAALRAIRARIDRAHETLGDTERRREYRRSAYSADQLDYFFELQLRKAEVVLKMRCDAAAALEVAESALELKPGEPEATIIAATALLQLGRRAEAGRAIRALKVVPSRLKRSFDDLASKLIG